MSAINKLQLKKSLKKLGVPVHGNFVKVKDLKKALAGQTEVRELEIFIDNDSTLYERYKLPIFKNLAAKKKRGSYDSALAPKAFYSMVDTGAKLYAKEYANPNEWNIIFSPEDRRQVAQNFAKEFESAYENKEYDFMG